MGSPSPLWIPCLQPGHAALPVPPARGPPLQAGQRHPGLLPAPAPSGLWGYELCLLICLAELSMVARVTGAGGPSEHWAPLGRKKRSGKSWNRDPWMDASPSSWGAASALCKALSHMTSLRLPPACQHIPISQKITRMRMIRGIAICGAPHHTRRQAKSWPRSSHSVL